MRDNDTSLVRAIRGPVTLITVGVLFALNNFTPYQFHQTWPVLLIVFGLLSLLRRSVEPVRRRRRPGVCRRRRTITSRRRDLAGQLPAEHVQ